MPIVKMPDGTSVSFPDDMEREEIRSMISSKFPDVAPKGTGWIAGAEKVLQEDIPALARTALRGVTFGQLADVQGLFSPELEERERARMAKVAEEYPISSVMADVAGSLTGGGALIKGFPKAYKAISKYGASSVPKAIATGSGVGGVSGGLYGAGTSEDKLKGATEGAILGGLAGVAGAGVGALAPAAVRGGRSLLERAKGLYGTKSIPAPQTAREIAEMSDMSPSVSASPELAGVAKVEQAIKKDFPDNYEQVIEAWKAGDESLAELYGAKSRQLAKGAAQYPTGQARAEEFFEKKLLKSPEKLKESISSNISSNNAYLATVDDILEVGRSEARPLYKKIETARIMPTEQNISILTSDEVASAFARAKKEYPTKLQGLQEDSVMAMDYTKRILDDDISKAIRSGEGNKASYLQGIKKELLGALDSSSPEYAMARKTSGDYLSLTRAMDDGKSFMKKDPEVLSKEFNKLGEKEKLAYRSGVAKQIRDLIDKTPEGQNPYNRIIGRPEQQNRLKAITTPLQFKNLMSDAKAQDRLFKLRNEVIGGSPTTSKAVAAAELAGFAGDLSTAGMSGAPIQSVATSGLRKMFDGLTDKTAKQVSDILFEERPTEKLKIYNAMINTPKLSNSERRKLKEIYFNAEDLFKTPEIKGALTGGVLVNTGDK